MTSNSLAISTATKKAKPAIISTKRKISVSNVVRPGRSAVACLAMRPNTVKSPKPTQTPIPLPPVHKVPWRAMFLDSMTAGQNFQGEWSRTRDIHLQLGSVGSVDAAIALLSPVRIERSNLRSLETESRRMSAGTFEPMVILTMSPATRSAAGNLWRIGYGLEVQKRLEGVIGLLECVTITSYENVRR